MKRHLIRAAGLVALLLAALPASASSPVNINTADATALASALDGVGMAKAQAIVAWREANGRFDSADQLTEVKGIGQSLVDRNRDAIQVDAAKPGAAAADAPKAARTTKPARSAKARSTPADD